MALLENIFIIKIIRKIILRIIFIYIQNEWPLQNLIFLTSLQRNKRYSYATAAVSIINKQVIILVGL